jgi:hypothetical protein
MKKFLALLLVIFTCFNAEAIPITHAAHPARVAATASAARRQRERRKQHEKDFHHGDLDCEVELIESFKFRESVLTIETWEIRKYHYKIDPDKCIIKTDPPTLKSLRPATEQEIKERQNEEDLF